jgi:hypothetical protein
MITITKGASMLTPQQQIYLQGVANKGADEIDKVVRVLRLASPDKFFHETKRGDGRVIKDPDMKGRKFFDKPTSLTVGDDYASHEVDALDPHLRYAQYEARSIKVLRRGMGLK